MVQIVKDQKYFLGIYLGLFLMMALVYFNMEKGDVLIGLSNYRMEFLNQFFRLMSFIVEPWFFILLSVLFIFKDYRHSLLIGVSGLCCLFLSKFLKGIFAQPRPQLYFQESGIWNQLQPLENYEVLTGLTSFPSGHTMAAFSLFFSLSIILKKPWIQIICLCLAILSGLSRIYLLNHFFEDVWAGSLIGMAIAFILKVLLDWSGLPPLKWTTREFQT